MRFSMLPIVIGGLIPAFLYGISGFLTKVSMRIGIGIGLYLIIVGMAVSAVGALSYLFAPDHTISLRSSISSAGVGVAWGVGTFGLALGLGHYGLPISKLGPIFNTNALFVVLLGFLFYAEWKEVQVLRLLIGTVLIVAGGVLVSRA